MKSVITVIVLGVVLGIGYNMWVEHNECEQKCPAHIECTRGMFDLGHAADSVCVPCPCDTFCVTTVEMSESTDCCAELCIAKESKTVEELLDRLAEVEVD